MCTHVRTYVHIIHNSQCHTNVDMHCTDLTAFLPEGEGPSSYTQDDVPEERAPLHTHDRPTVVIVVVQRALSWGEGRVLSAVEKDILIA